MSSGQKQRTPEHFPRMKVRGARRRKIATWQRLVGQYSRLNGSIGMAAESIRILGQVLDTPAAEVNEIVWHE